MSMQMDKRGLKFGTGSLDINSRVLPANFTPTYYTPAQVGSEGTDKVSSHLKGLDTKVSNLNTKSYSIDVSFDGIVTQKDVDVSSGITDARKAHVSLLDNANSYERIFCKITATSSSNIRINTNLPLPSGSYRLIITEII